MLFSVSVTWPSNYFAFLKNFGRMKQSAVEISLSLHSNGRFPGGPWLAGTRVFPFCILLELKPKGDGGGSDNWNYKTCKTAVKSSPPTNQHPFFTGRMPLLSPRQRYQSTTQKIPTTCMEMLRPSNEGVPDFKRNVMFFPDVVMS